ncbi:flagellar hook-basal body complex protein [Clostridium sp. MSJ-4]|uniref:Flagellar hook protein FlgE n=1 Tax=Clostridium simiarum TaxID=2841506 RepID=A0ABS6EXX2_9CLOT|nr:flagellar hook-basal body complex protein [Clostridium simiarum]MBU5591073.1 flagellar hook-basal body complex protein [Clostridium simiarum]
MLRSMYSGISGMRVNQTKLDVIGNNIANVGTTAFKVQRVRFQDMISQNAGRASGPSRNLGGINPRQVGLGVQLAGIDTVVSQGNMQPTARNLDVAIDGEGYFMVARGETVFENGIEIYKPDATADSTFELPTDTKGLDIMFTRDGSFIRDHEGNLLNSDGYRILGYSVFGSDDATKDPDKADVQSIAADGTLNFVDADSKKLHASGDLRTLKIPEKIKVKDDAGNEVDKRIIDFTIEKNGVIKATVEGGQKAVIGQVAMASFRNPAGLEKIGGNLMRNSPNSGEAVIRAGVLEKNDDGTSKPSNEAGYGDILQGVLEMSNVDLAEQFTDMIVATRGFQASGKMISTGDEILQDIINLKR